VQVEATVLLLLTLLVCALGVILGALAVPPRFTVGVLAPPGFGGRQFICQQREKKAFGHPGKGATPGLDL
jgi:hypothetical protein